MARRIGPPSPTEPALPRIRLMKRGLAGFRTSLTASMGDLLLASAEARAEATEMEVIDPANVDPRRRASFSRPNNWPPRPLASLAAPEAKSLARLNGWATYDGEVSGKRSSRARWADRAVPVRSSRGMNFPMELAASASATSREVSPRRISRALSFWNALRVP